MKINVHVVDYTTMTLKQLENEHTKEGQVLLDMINSNKYTMKDIEKQKSFVDTLYKMICKRNVKINKMKG